MSGASGKHRTLTDISYVGGMHAVKALLKANASDTSSLMIQKGRKDSRLRSIVSLAQKAGIVVREVSRHELDEFAGGVEHQGVLAEFNGEPIGNETSLFKHLENCSGSMLVLVLDGLQDPHNLGACIRSADAAGVDAIVLPTDNSVGVTPVVRKVASGAVETMPLFHVTNLQRVFKKLKDAGIWIYGAAGEAESVLYDIDFTGSVAIVMGSEGSGLRRLTRDACDELFKIPMQGSVSSLNVSVATGVSLFEVQRQRQ